MAGGAPSGLAALEAADDGGCETGGWTLSGDSGEVLPLVSSGIVTPFPGAEPLELLEKSHTF